MPCIREGVDDAAALRTTGITFPLRYISVAFASMGMVICL